MLNDGGTLILSPTDLVGFLACEHLTVLERSAARGERDRPQRDDPELDVLSRRGTEHELRYLADLKGRGLDVVEIERGDEKVSAALLTELERRTVDAMHAGVDVIFQATFFDGRWMGFADFLVKVDRPSDLGAWSYEVEDTKLARQVKPAALLQLAAYAEHVARIQGHPPDHIHVRLGTMERRSFPLRELAAYHRTVKAQFEAALAADTETYPDPVSHCALCRWADVCDGRRRDDDHLSLVAWMRRDQTRKFADAGITTVEELADAPPDVRPGRMGTTTAERLREQARLQVVERRTGQRIYELLEAEPDRGLCLLPEPSPGDLFLDLEGDPFVGDEGLEYLFGVVEIDERGAPVFHPFWGHDDAEEKAAFEAVIDLIVARLERWPDLHVYHYAPYEETAFKRLMGRHGTREDEVDRLLRGGVLVDLYRVVRQGVRVSAESYSIKQLEPLYMQARDADVKDAASSIVAYERWLEEGDPALLQGIEDYNREDCISTWKLGGWLEERRTQAAADFGGGLPRPAPREAEPPAEVGAAQEVVAELERRLLDRVPDDRVARSADEQARWLLAQLVSWHRREAKSTWWTYFSRMAMTDEELAEDADAIGGVEFAAHLGAEKRSVAYRYRFDPTQDFTIAVGDTVHKAGSAKGSYEVLALDAVDGTIDLKTGRDPDDPPATSLVPYDIVPDSALREAVQRVARSVIAHGIDGAGPYRAVRDLLRGQPPRIGGVPAGEPLADPADDPTDAAVRLSHLLDDTCLPIQGPPGAGKTYTAAQVALSLVASGKRVGITALSHKAITNLLDEICACAAETGASPRIIQKVSKGGTGCGNALVECVTSNTVVEDRLDAGQVDIVAGTAWLFSREAFDQRLDVLIVDEASQLPLANAVAVGAAARSIILVGDPQQLAQPSKGAHPPGSGVSALEHILDGHATVPSDGGLFLATTRRLHPDVCAFTSEVAYEGRLRPHAVCARRRLEDGSGRAVTGLRFVPVDHVGDRTESLEEARVVRQLVDELIGMCWIDERGQASPVTVDDVVVVAPYNLQVARLREVLPDGARVGTVDKFQGQQAPVAVYSMTTATPEDMPRGMEFLYSLNRLNVATSRALALAIVVASPHLLTVRCRKPSQLRLANALCRFVEMADSVPPASATSSSWYA
ncbi:MAG: TM0106 family RecB-like putative nuclease [Actinobacteria bacterium]|nr:TM0106 family RecB-like putative nuclease [Actinomycetota bacterium]